MPRTKEYLVTWQIEVSATSPKKAAGLALKMQRDPSSTATVFSVARVFPGFGSMHERPAEDCGTFDAGPACTIDGPTVDVKEVVNGKMIAGNEKKFTDIVHKGKLKHWVGFAWVEERDATAADRKKFPVVTENGKEVL